MDRKQYYWIVADLDGQPYLIFGGDNEEEARRKGIENLGANFDIKKFPTRDITAASRMLRGHKLETSHDLRKAAKRQGHEKSLLRKRQQEVSNERGDGYG